MRESSLPAPVVRTLLQPSQLLGLSVHSIQDAVAAERHGADFVVLGPIYDTPSKREYGAPLGLRYSNRPRAGEHSIFAIGGMTASRTREVRQAGAFGVAVLSSILSASNVEVATEKFLSAIERGS